MSAKIIVLGSLNGQLEAAFKKLAALHAKNRFDCAIVTGNLFGADEDGEAAQQQVGKLLAGEIDVPVATYFTVGSRPLPARIVAKIEGDDGGDGDEICPNLHYLGKRSVTKTTAGLRIVALGGRLEDAGVTGGASVPGGDASSAKDQWWMPFHTAEDEKALRGAHSADILLTAVWPAGVWKGSQVSFPDDGVREAMAASASSGLAELVATLRPRYHLTSSSTSLEDSSSSFFYEREAFFHPERPDQTHSLAIDVTRFLSLADFGNPAKAKAMYAFSLVPSTGALGAPPPSTLVPAGCTASPFLDVLKKASSSSSGKRRAPLETDPYSRFGGHERGGGGGGRQGKRRKGPAGPPPGPDRCYFCLSNPNLPTHMVCSIGNDAYLATAKGPLPMASTFAAQGLAFPGHMLIVPLSHAPQITAEAMGGGEGQGPVDGVGGGGGGVAGATRREMVHFRQSLQTMVATRSRQALGTVTWEISRRRNVHVHWQCLPVEASLVRRGLVEAAFRVEAENMELPRLETVGKGGGGSGDANAEDAELEGDYVRIWIETGVGAAEGGEGEAAAAHKRITLVMHLDEEARFDLQYPRKVMAKLMGLESRIVWQDCAQTEEEETADVAAFRKAFADWDFTLEA